MNKKIKINKLLRIFVISILFLNVVPIMTASATDLYIYAMSNSNVYIDGAFKGVSSWGMLQTSTTPGTHTLKVTAPGFQDYVATINIVSTSYEFLSTSMYPLPKTTPNPYSTPTPAPTTSVYLQIQSVPSGADVYNDYTKIGTTPFLYEIPYAQTITFKLSGYGDKVAYVEPTTLSPFTAYLISTKSIVIPTPTPTPTPVLSSYKEIRSEPSGANVYYGSTLIGTTPFYYNLPYTQIMTFKLAGYTNKVTYIEPSTPSPFIVYMSR